MTAINEYFQNLDRWRDHKIYTSGIFPTTGLSASDYKMIMQVLIRNQYRRSRGLVALLKETRSSRGGTRRLRRAAGYA